MHFRAARSARGPHFLTRKRVTGRQLRRNEQHTTFGECRCDISSVNFHGELNISAFACLLTRSLARSREHEMLSFLSHLAKRRSGLSKRSHWSAVLSAIYQQPGKQLNGIRRRRKRGRKRRDREKEREKKEEGTTSVVRRGISGAAETAAGGGYSGLVSDVN